MFKSGTIKNSFTFVGTLIGAGFASGKEIAVFFGNQSIFAPILACFITAICAMVFLAVGCFCNNAIACVFKRAENIVTILIVLTNFIIFATMISATNTITIANSFGGSLGILLALVCLGVIMRKSNLGTLNTIVIPLVICLILLLFILSQPKIATVTRFDVKQPVLYATFNLLSAGLILAKHPTRKNISIPFTGLWIFVILLTLVLPIYLMVKEVPDAVMPLQTIADNFRLSAVGGIIIFLAIFTTATSSLQLVVDNKPHIAPLVVTLAMFVSLIGFNNLVVSFYPTIGILGIIITAFFILFAICNHKQIFKPTTTTKIAI